MDLNDLLALGVKFGTNALADTDAVGDAKEWLDANPVAKSVIQMSLVELQKLIKDAGIPSQPGKPIGADALRAMAHDAVSNIRESQTVLEQFIQIGLDTSDGLVEALGVLIKK